MNQSPAHKNHDNRSTGPVLMPLRMFVVKITGEADAGDDQSIKKAVRRYHNRLANGSIPRSVFRKIGKELFVIIPLFYELINFPSNTSDGYGQSDLKQPATDGR